MSAATDGYRIADEPRPGPLGQLAVNPIWPLLAVMLGGTWIAWPWFALNAFAVGSPKKLREILWVVGGFVGTVILLVTISATLVGTGAGDDGPWLRYALVAVVVWKLWVSYRLYLLQARTFQIHEYFGGVARNGMLPVLVAFYLRGQILGAFPSFFVLVLA